ncbi:CsgG/HfaB family protein [Piscinibacter koreensis]|uniref:Peptidoglycan-binding protein n=1 Tax=Piscinibacter koreensis TaxID=2742824 RepID=A0A7Y6TVX4_9BURK|nr:CsgG/HfaB family protein [Schlegelella koreensis]NUZ05448.1 peptidoglycan-binding protein [Schlegelella koreensis]
MNHIPSRWLLAAAAFLVLPAAAQTLGGGGSLATGGAGPDGAQGANEELERCSAPKGTLAVVEPQSQVGANLQRYGLGSPTQVLRMLIQQSNCFQVVERGVGMNSMMQERSLAKSGELQSDSNIGRGQMVAADFIVTPSVVFSENDTGGVGGAIGGLLGGRHGRALGAIAGGVKFKEAETNLLLVDSRSGIQVAAAQGSARKTDFAVGGALWGGLAAAGGGYTRTPEGKVIVASFIDNWNNIVRNIRENPSLVQARGSAASQQNAAMSVRANAGAAGDVMLPKIAGVKVLRQPRDGAGEMQTLTRTDEVLLLGEEQNGYSKVTSSRGDGWVKTILLKKP